MIQKQGDDGDHIFDDKHRRKIPRAHLFMRPQSLACVHDTHSLTHSLDLPHTKAPTWPPRFD